MATEAYIPEKIAKYRVYLDGEELVGTTGSVDLPQFKLKTSTTSGAGVGGNIESPTPGQWETTEHEITFNTVYGGFGRLLQEGMDVNLTFRGAQQVIDRTGKSVYKNIVINEGGKIKAFTPGKLEGGSGMDAKITLEVIRFKMESGGETVIDIDKLNDRWRVNGRDMMAEINAMC